MSKRIAIVLALLLAVSGVPMALSQMDQPKTIYTYVSQFQIPRANWAEYAASTEKNFVPVADKLVADGTIVSYSTFEAVVHTPDGYTNGAAWSSTSIAGLMKTLDEVRKMGPQPGQNASTRHEDYLMMSTMHSGGQSGKGTSGYLRVICSQAKPDNPDAYSAAIKKFLWPAFEEQIKSGAASYVGLDQQYVNTSAPSMRCLVITYPNAEGMDKWANAIGAVIRNANQADRDAFNSASVTDSRRDFLARITHFASK